MKNEIINKTSIIEDENLVTINSLRKNQFLSSAMLVNIDKKFNKNNIDQKSIEDLYLLLKYSLNKIFKDFIHNSKEAKLQLNGNFESLKIKIDQNFSILKIDKLKEHEEICQELEKRISLIDEKIKLNKWKNKEIEKDIKDKTKSISKQKNLLLIEKKDDKDIKQYNLKEGEKVNFDNSEDINKDAANSKKQLKNLGYNISQLSNEKNKIIEKINNLKMKFTNMIDAEYILKEKNKIQLEMDRIEVFIFMRNNLLTLNRHIRNVKIQLAIKKIEEKWSANEQIVEDIAKTSKSIKKEFDLFDNVSDNKSAVDSVQEIDTSTRIINLKTFEVN